MNDDAETCRNCAFLERGKCLLDAAGRAGCKAWASVAVLGDKGPLGRLWRMIGKG